MMTAEQLKNSIYQLAIQGKLVEQYDSDGNAVDLVYEIEKKRKSLLKSGKIKPLKGIESIDEVPFDIPESWTWVRLGSIVSIISDGTHRTPNYVENGIPFLSVQNISQGYFDMTKAKYITPDEHKELIRRCKPEKDDILVCRIGTLGKAIKVAVDFEFSIFVSLGLIRLVDTRLVDYVICVINSGYGKKWIDEVKVGGGTHTNKINLKSFPNFLIPLPPLNEQARILEKLDEFNSLLSEYAVANTKLNTLNASFPEMMRKSILQEAVQGKLVPQDPNDEPASLLLKKLADEKKRLIKEGKIKKQKPLPEITEDEIPFDIPESWEWTRWGTISESIQYGYNAPALESGRIKMVRISDIQNNTVKWDTVPYCEINEDVIPDYLLKENDILFARTGGTVGKSLLVKGAAENAIYAGYLIRTRYSHNLCPEYLKYFMESDLYWRQLRNGTIATAQPNCNGQTLSKMIIPIPPLKEQYRIANKLNAVLVHTDDLK